MMKELYTSPEAELQCFAPAENLAEDEISFGIDDGTKPDLIIDIGKLL